MSDDVRRTRTPAGHHLAVQPAESTGNTATGRIFKLMIGQGYGFIRLPNRREVFFHRKDLNAGTSFNDLSEGDAVCFELIDDPISGARALRVRCS